MNANPTFIHTDIPRYKTNALFTPLPV